MSERIVSLNVKVKQVCALAGTKDVTEWEDSFLAGLATRTNSGERTSGLSEKQIDVIERIWRKHFA